MATYLVEIIQNYKENPIYYAEINCTNYTEVEEYARELMQKVPEENVKGSNPYSPKITLIKE